MSERQVTWRDRLRYRFEVTLSKGTVAIIGWLALVSLTPRSAARSGNTPTTGIAGMVST
jgi:hypothetical protein